MTKFMKLNIQLFAVSLVTQSLTEQSYDISSNTSQVRYLVQLKTTGTSYNDYGVTTTYTIDGTTYTSTKKLPLTTTTTIVDQTVTVKHNNDGSKTVSASFSCPTGTSAGTITNSISTTLTTIPRATDTINISGTIGSTVSFTLNPKSSSFSHKVRLDFVNDYDEINIPANYTYPYPYQIPDKFYKQLEFQAYVGDVTVYTYSNGTYVGESTGGQLTLYADINACTPTGTVKVVDANEKTTKLTGNASKIIPNYSTAKVTVTAEAKKYASISAKTFTIGGVTYNIGDSNTLTIEKVPEATGRYYIRDSRDFTNSYYNTGNTTIYYADLITDFTFARPTPTGNQMYYTLKGQFWSENFGGYEEKNGVDNTLTLKWRVSEKNGTPSEWQDVEYSIVNNGQIISGSNVDEQTQVFITNPLSDDGTWDYQKAYTFETLSEDKLNSFQSTKAVTKGVPIFNWYEKNDINYFNVNGTITNNDEPLTSNNYSTSERKVGTWLGKTLYRKVMSFTTTVISTSTTSFAHNISNADLVMIKNAYLYNSSNGQCYPLPITLYNSNTTEDKLSIRCDRTNVVFYAASGWGTGWTKIVILEYTKTTD